LGLENNPADKFSQLPEDLEKLRLTIPKYDTASNIAALPENFSVQYSEKVILTSFADNDSASCLLKSNWHIA